MPWSGGGVFTRLYSWVSDRDAGLDILASRMDQDTDDLAQGLMHCLTVNGETQPLANLNMSNFRITGAAAGVNSGDYVTVDQVLNGGGGFPAGGFLPLSGGTLSGPLQVGAATGGGPAPLILETGNLQLARADQAYASIVRNNLSGPRNLSLTGPGGAQIDNILLDAALVTVSGGLLAAGSLTVNGAGNFTGSVGITGDVGVHSLTASGGLTVAAGLNVTAGGFFVSGDAVIGGILTANGGLTTGGLVVNGSAQIAGALAANGGLTVAGGFHVVSGDASFAGALNVGAAVGFNSSLTVAGAVGLGSSGIVPGNELTVGGNVGIFGNLNITGTINGHPALAFTARAARLDELPRGARLLYVVD